ncbi:MAG: CoA transferase [Burkholderiales bacterium]|nr:CoA transferase [Burkholderiales bacterium]
MTRTAGRRGPLAGIRVLDFTRVVAGPYCTMLLGDFGADVVKIEEPGVGDELRALGPPFLGEESVFFLSVNRNKRSVTLDLKDADALAKVREMARRADVVVENFRPGVMDRLGLGYASLRRLNPRLIYCSVSAFDARTSYGGRPGYDLLVSGVSGLQSVTGEPGRAPLRPGVNLVDLTAGTNAALGILMAVIARNATGRGQKVDVSLMDGAFAILGQLAAIYLNTGNVPARRPPEDLHPQIVPYGTFLARDGRYLNVTVPNNKFWGAFCAALDRAAWADDPRFATNAKRIANRAVLIPLVAARFAEDTRNRWIKRLLARDVPAGPVNTIDEVVRDRYIEEAGMLVRMMHASCGEVVTPAIPIRMSATPGRVRLPPPRLGEHNDKLLGRMRRPRAGSGPSRNR